jgi:hypothetical protein
MSEAAVADPVQEREEWIETIHELFVQITGWAAARKWTVSTKSLELTEDLLGTYQVPSLTLQTGRGAVMLEPVARRVMGAAGRIDLYAYPSLFRVMLLRSTKDGQWLIRTDSGIFIKQPWNEETFAELVEDLTGAA